jgi:hypothetical protein
MFDDQTIEVYTITKNTTTTIPSSGTIKLSEFLDFVSVIDSANSR